MLIYVGHSKELEYEALLYEPIRKSDLFHKHTFFFPHEKQNSTSASREIIEKCDAMMAEVSYPSTGLGIELGFASMFQKPIGCFYRKGVKISNSLGFITSEMIEYEDSGDLIVQLGTWVEKSMN